MRVLPIRAQGAHKGPAHEGPAHKGPAHSASEHTRAFFPLQPFLFPSASKDTRNKSLPHIYESAELGGVWDSEFASIRFEIRSEVKSEVQRSENEEKRNANKG